MLERWKREGRLISLCPEVAAGLQIPRARAEIMSSAGGRAVLHGGAQVRDDSGTDLTHVYQVAATHAVALARAHGARVAILKDGSPSCGTSYTYDGSFAGARVELPGVVAAALAEANVMCFAGERLAEAAAYVAMLESDAASSPGELKS